MTNSRLTMDEAQAFLDANPAVQWIDTFIFNEQHQINQILHP